MDRVKREEVYVWRESRGRMYGEKVGEVGGIFKEIVIDIIKNLFIFFIKSNL